MKTVIEIIYATNIVSVKGSDDKQHCIDSHVTRSSLEACKCNSDIKPMLGYHDPPVFIVYS